jgi:hypothetical protein
LWKKFLWEAEARSGCSTVVVVAAAAAADDDDDGMFKKVTKITFT